MEGRRRFLSACRRFGPPNTPRAVVALPIDRDREKGRAVERAPDNLTSSATRGDDGDRRSCEGRGDEGGDFHHPAPIIFFPAGRGCAPRIAGFPPRA